MVIKGQINTETKYLAIQAFMEYKKLHFAGQLLSLIEYYQSDRKISPERGNKKHKLIECI